MSTDSSGSDAAGRTRVVVRPVGTPLPLGFLALFTGSVVLAAPELQWVSPAQSHVIAIALLGFVAPLQGLACVFGLLARDPVAASGIGVLAGTWTTTGVSLLASPPGSTSPGLGVLLVVAAGALLLPAGVAATSKGGAGLVIAAAAVRFAISGGYELTGAPGWQHAAGIAGLVVAGLAGYGATAFELESALGHTVLPVLRRQRGRRAVSGRLGDQVADIAHEAGVREQL